MIVALHGVAQLCPRQFMRGLYEFAQVLSILDRHPVMQLMLVQSHPSKQLMYALHAPSTALISDPQLACSHELHAELPAPVDGAAPLQVGGAELPLLELLLLHPTTTTKAADMAVTNIARIFMDPSSM